MTTQRRSAALTFALICFIGLCCLVPEFSEAQVLSGNKMPEALKDIKQANGVCVLDGAAAKTAMQAQEGTSAADLTCAIAVPDALTLLGKSDTVVVDTRSTNEFASFQIEGSLNLTVSELRHKTFLRDKAIVLVGSGKAERVLYEACTDLKKNGFKQVRVLRGGLTAWLSYAQPLGGRSPSAYALGQLSPEELWAESQFDANLVLVSNTQLGIQSLLQQGILIAQDSKEEIKAMLERHQKFLKKGFKNAWKGNALASLVLVTTNNASEQIADLRQALKPIPLLIYSDTADNFNRYMARQETVWVAQAHGPKQPKCGL